MYDDSGGLDFLHYRNPRNDDTLNVSSLARVQLRNYKYLRPIRDLHKYNRIFEFWNVKLFIYLFIYFK